MEFLSQKGIEYEDRDISEKQEYLDELVGMGYMATPVTLINGQAVVGYDPVKLNGLLGTFGR